MLALAVRTCAYKKLIVSGVLKAWLPGQKAVIRFENHRPKAYSIYVSAIKIIFFFADSGVCACQSPDRSVTF